MYEEIIRRRAMVARNPEKYTCHLAEMTRNGVTDTYVIHFSIHTGFTQTVAGHRGCDACRTQLKKLVNRQLPPDQQLPIP